MLLLVGPTLRAHPKPTKKHAFTTFRSQTLFGSAPTITCTNDSPFSFYIYFLKWFANFPFSEHCLPPFCPLLHCTCESPCTSKLRYWVGLFGALQTRPTSVFLGPALNFFPHPLIAYFLFHINNLLLEEINPQYKKHLGLLD